MIDGISGILDSFELSGSSPDLPEVRPVRDIFAAHERRSWDKSTEARCNFVYRPRLVRRGGVWFFALWQKSVTGRTLTDIKADPAEIPHFAEAVSGFILDVVGRSLPSGFWAICTTPKRRHKERNFATLVSQEIAARIGVPFYEDVAFCRSKQRINAVFDINLLPEEPNIILFDDFVTTGSTLGAMHRLLAPLGKNILIFTGINNAI